jgi:hypothetical protein
MAWFGTRSPAQLNQLFHIVRYMATWPTYLATYIATLTRASPTI